MKARHFIFWLHLCVGLSIGLMLLLTALTGAMLAFRPQILDQLEHDVRFLSAVPNTIKLSDKVLLKKARELYPESEIKKVVLKKDPTATAIVNLGKQKGLVFLNPYTGELVGQETQATKTFRLVEALHRWLGMDGKLKKVGSRITGLNTLLFGLMIISGVYLWWPRKTAKLKPLKGQARYWNWHNVAGIWLSPILLTSASTGFVISYIHPKNMPWIKRLHTGELLGSVGQALVFCGACAAILLIVTGFTLAAYRWIRSRRPATLMRKENN